MDDGTGLAEEQVMVQFVQEGGINTNERRFRINLSESVQYMKRS